MYQNVSLEQKQFMIFQHPFPFQLLQLQEKNWRVVELMASPETTCMQKNQTVCTNKWWWINLLKNICCVRASLHCVSNSLHVFLPLIFYVTFMMLWSPIAAWWLQFNTFSQVGINYILTLIWSLILPGRPWPRGLALEIIMVADALMPNSEKLYVESPSKVIKFVDTFLVNF